MLNIDLIISSEYFNTLRKILRFAQYTDYKDLEELDSLGSLFYNNDESLALIKISEDLDKVSNIFKKYFSQITRTGSICKKAYRNLTKFTETLKIHLLTTPLKVLTLSLTDIMIELIAAYKDKCENFKALGDYGLRAVLEPNLGNSLLLEHIENSNKTIKYYADGLNLTYAAFINKKSRKSFSKLELFKLFYIL